MYLHQNKLKTSKNFKHFATISQEYPPLDVTSLPERVQTKLECVESPPTVSDYEAYRQIRAAKKPRSGVPNDLPRLSSIIFIQNNKVR